MSMFALVAMLAAALTSGCAVESMEAMAEPMEDAAEPATEEITSSLVGSAPVTWVGVNFFTGGDDKRSDSRVWVHINLYNGNSSSQEILPGLGWADWTSTGLQWVYAPAGTRNQDIRDVTIEWQQGGGGWNGDNWNMQSLNIYAFDSSYGSILKGSPGGNPLRRFTGSVTQYSWLWVQ